MKKSEKNWSICWFNGFKIGSDCGLGNFYIFVTLYHKDIFGQTALLLYTYSATE